MKLITKLTLFLAIVACLASCGRKVPFTSSLYENNNWNDDELKKIQFYISDDIILKRAYTDGDTRIDGGKIRMENGKEIEEIIIQAGTPGVFLFKSTDNNNFAVTFEAKGDDRYLMFGVNPNSSSSDRYKLLASGLKNKYGTVSYDKRKFRTKKSSFLAHLLVNLKRVQRIRVKQHKAKGRKVK